MELSIAGNGLFDLVENILYVGGTIFAAILVALSISAYRNTHLKKILYATIAFLLFGIFLFYEYLEYAIPLDNPFTDILLPSMALSILVLFFLAIVKKK
ncbi:MAG TPA: hypothetical protein VJM74_02700 [Nitrososphaeraceae archaeon]|nr:hypothetical protein [Nitrososphaeraceae archaeon]